MPSNIPLAAKIIWNELAPNFAVLPPPLTEDAYASYHQGMVSVTEYWKSKKGSVLWEAITDNVRNVLIQQLRQSIDNLESLTSDTLEGELFDISMLFWQLYKYLHKLRKQLMKSTEADVGLVGRVAGHPGEASAL